MHLRALKSILKVLLSTPFPAHKNESSSDFLHHFVIFLYISPLVDFSHVQIVPLLMPADWEDKSSFCSRTLNLNHSLLVLLLSYSSTIKSLDLEEDSVNSCWKLHPVIDFNLQTTRSKYKRSFFLTPRSAILNLLQIFPTDLHSSQFYKIEDVLPEECTEIPGVFMSRMVLLNIDHAGYLSHKI